MCYARLLSQWNIKILLSEVKLKFKAKLEAVSVFRIRDRPQTSS